MTTPSLNTMPALVMEKIVEKSDWKAVLTLRCVCQHLRQQVDCVPESSLPDTKFHSIRVLAGSRSIEIRLYSSLRDIQLGNPHFISYRCKKNGKFKRRRVEFDSKHLVEMAKADLLQVLKFQKTTLKEFKITFNRMDEIIQNFPDVLSDVLKCKNKWIKTEELQLSGCNANQIICLLSTIDPRSLKSIRFVHGRHQYDFDEIAKTPQWRSAEKFYMNTSASRISAHYLTHFSEVELQGCHQMSGQELDILKTAYSNSSNFVTFKVIDSLFLDTESLSTLWRPPPLFGENWYFRMQNNDDDILAVRHEYCSIEIARIKLYQVPNGVVIRQN